MIDGLGEDRDLSVLVVPAAGAVEAGNDLWEPVRLIDSDGEPVVAVMAFLRELQASGRSAATQRSYAMDLLRWFRFGWAIDVGWDQATRVEARDFCRWLAVRDKPTRAGSGAARRRVVPNAVTGKPARGRSTPRRRGRTRRRCCGCSTTSIATPGRVRWSTRSRCRGNGPVVGRMPITTRWSRSATSGWGCIGRGSRSGSRGAIPDELFNRVFAELGSHRDRALVALWVSTGARAAELLGVRCGDVDPGQQLVTVVRKGTRALQQLPASPDAFVWLRLYQCGLDPAVPTGRDDPLWWTRRRPFRPLTYPRGAGDVRPRRRRAGGQLDVARPAAYRRLPDGAGPAVAVDRRPVGPRTRPPVHHPAVSHADARRRDRRGPRPSPPRRALRLRRPVASATPVASTAPSGYRRESLDVLFGGRTS